jgi:molecular chaperone DnaK (HSP70)
MTFGADGRITVGWQAKDHAVENPTSTVYSIKRLMGRGFDELTADGELAQLPYKVVKRAAEESGRDIAGIEIEGKLLTPPEMSAVILRELKDRASKLLGREVRKAIITVPAYFDDAQRQATRDAGRIAGLEVLRIINEPTAAALAYGLGVRGQLERQQKAVQSDGSLTLPLAGACPSGSQCKNPAHKPADNDSLIAVYDLGGGTFDISILRVVDDVFEVLSTHGNTRLGGDDLDREIIHLFEREILDQFGLNINAPATRQAMRSLAENIKIRLSNETSASVEIDLDQQRKYRRTLGRDEFEALILPWVDKTIASCQRALADAHVEPDMIDQVVLVGGSTRMPLVRRRVEEAFGRAPYTAVNPDEVVALGAAVQAGVLGGVRRDALLLDVIPLSLGIETLGGAMSKLILRNSRIPCQATERFSTFVDGQTNIKINVLQGERELAEDCRSLGEFELRGIPPMPAGIPKLIVAFLVDENGILNVSAREERSGSEASIQIVPTHGLTPDEVKRMELESIAHAREDMKAHQLIDLRNQVVFDTQKTEQMLATVGAGLNAEQRATIEKSIRELRSLAETTRDADGLFATLKAFDRGTVRLAELAIAQTLRQQEDMETSTGMK